MAGIGGKTEGMECGWGCGLEQSNGIEGIHPLKRISELVQEVCVHGQNEYGYDWVFPLRGTGSRTGCRCGADSALSPTESLTETHRAHKQAELRYEYMAA